MKRLRVLLFSDVWNAVDNESVLGMYFEAMEVEGTIALEWLDYSITVKIEDLATLEKYDLIVLHYDAIGWQSKELLLEVDKACLKAIKQYPDTPFCFMPNVPSSFILKAKANDCTIKNVTHGYRELIKRVQELVALPIAVESE